MVTMTLPPMPDRPVTAFDLFAEVSATRRDVSELLIKAAVMAATQQLASAQMTDIEVRLRTLQGSVPDQLAARLTAVERWQWRTGGALAALATVLGFLGGYLGTLIAHLH
jgi:hypothetical protein